jgi:hypothetical protein
MGTGAAAELVRMGPRIPLHAAAHGSVLMRT